MTWYEISMRKLNFCADKKVITRAVSQLVYISAIGGGGGGKHPQIQS